MAIGVEIEAVGVVDEEVGVVEEAVGTVPLRHHRVAVVNGGLRHPPAVTIETIGVAAAVGGTAIRPAAAAGIKLLLLPGSKDLRGLNLLLHLPLRHRPAAESPPT